MMKRTQAFVICNACAIYLCCEMREFINIVLVSIQPKHIISKQFYPTPRQRNNRY